MTGILKLMESHGYIRRESVKEGCQTETNCPDCEGRRDTVEDSGADSEDRGEIAGRNPQENVTTCKQILWQMFHNISEMNEEENKKDE